MKNKNNKIHKSLHKKISNLIFYFILFLLILTGILVWMLDTPTGFETLIRLAKPLLNKQGISISGPINGVLADFEISRIQINALDLENVRINIHLRDLFEDQINLKTANAHLKLGSLDIPINLSGHISLSAPHAFNLSGKLIIQNQDSLKTNLKTNFQIAGNLTHYQFTVHGQGTLLGREGHLIIQGFGSMSEIHTEELAFNLSRGSLDGSLNLSSFSPWSLKASIQGKDIPLDQNAFDANNLISFQANLLANPDSQDISLKANTALWNSEIHANRLSNTGIMTLDPLDIHTPFGLWSLPKTPITLLPNLFNLPNTCLTYQINNPINNPANNQTLCASASFQNKILNANLKLDIKNINTLQDFFPETNDLQGILKGSMNISGSLSELKYRGNIDLSDASLGLSRWGIVLQKASLSLTSQNEPLIHIHANAQSGLGTASAQGSLSYQQNILDITLGIEGSQFTLMNLPLAHVIASPHLAYTQNSKIMSLTGVINIDSALINADDYKLFSSEESPDVIFVDNKNNIIRDKKTLPFAINLTLIAGPKIQFTGFGINTGISGHITVSSVANMPSFADGKLNLINGQYQAYGKHFTITQGALIFNHSPLTNPSLDVTATYAMTAIVMGSSSISAITVGVKVSGTIHQIHLTLFSNPPMSQENILSYIATGQPLSQAGPGSQSAISQAALSFASGGGDQTVLNKIQDAFKLNQLSVGSLNNLPSNNLNQDRETNSPGQDNTAVFIGKSLSSRFYVSYGVGLFNNEQIFMTHFTLSPHFYIQTDTSTLDSGADLFYTFEH